MTTMAAHWSVLLLLVSVGLVAGSEQLRNFTCDSCSEEVDFVKMLRINEIKNTILEKLRLHTVPNISREDLEHLPPLDTLISDFGFNTEMYSDQPADPLGENSYYETDKFHIRPEKAAVFPDDELTPKYIAITNWVVPENLFQFKISSTLLARNLQHAEFQFYLSCAVFDELKSFTAVIEKVVRTQQGFRTKKGGAVELRNQECERGGRWIQIDVKKELTSWFTSAGDDNLGLRFRIYDSQGLEVNLQLPVHGKHRPFLKLTVNDVEKVRKRRFTGLVCDENSKVAECCRYPFTIDFEEFQWPWIIAPKKYDAYFCHGNCRIAINSRQHLFSQAYASKQWRGRQATRCCTPKSLRSISMLYVDDEKNVVHGVLPGMVVESCSCHN